MYIKELRIGNLVNSLKENYADKGITEVESISKYDINPWSDMGASGSLTFEDVKGIPLSDEWLLKFGFEKKERATYIKSFNNIGLEVNMQFKKVWINHEMSQDSIDLGNMYFVHQLQNLYFALTGEEIMIKE